MLDALQRVLGVEQRKAVLVAVALQVAGLQCRSRVCHDTPRSRVRGDDVADHGHVVARQRHAAPLFRQAGKGLRAGLFVHQVAGSKAVPKGLVRLRATLGLGRQRR